MKVFANRRTHKPSPMLHPSLWVYIHQEPNCYRWMLLIRSNWSLQVGTGCCITGCKTGPQLKWANFLINQPASPQMRDTMCISSPTGKQTIPQLTYKVGTILRGDRFKRGLEWDKFCLLRHFVRQFFWSLIYSRTAFLPSRQWNPASALPFSRKRIYLQKWPNCSIRKKRSWFQGGSSGTAMGEIQRIRP